MPMNWGQYSDADLSKYYNDYKSRVDRYKYSPGGTGGVDPNDPNWAALSQEYNRRVGARAPGQYPQGGTVPGVPGGNTFGGYFGQAARQWGQSPDNPNNDPIARAGRDLPGEDAYYKNQMGTVQRALGAQRDSAQMNLGQALENRGFGNSGLVGQGYAAINQGYGQQLGQALGGINDARFSAREQRIGRAQDQQFQQGQQRRNFEYQLTLLKTQLAQQGRTDILSYIDSLAGGLFDMLYNSNSGGGGGSNAPDYSNSYAGD